MKIGFSQFFHPTPDKVKLFGKSLSASAVAAAAIVAITGGNQIISWALMGFAFVGSFLTNFVGVDNIATEVINKPESQPIKADVETNIDTGEKTIVQ